VRAIRNKIFIIKNLTAFSYATILFNFFACFCVTVNIAGARSIFISTIMKFTNNKKIDWSY